jgi:hypothetical protein
MRVFKRQMAHNVGFRPRTLAPAEGCRFKTHFLSEPAGKCSLAGDGCNSWLGSASWCWSASVFWKVVFLEFCRPIRIPTRISDSSLLVFINDDYDPTY